MLSPIVIFLCLTALEIFKRSDAECQPEIITCPCGRKDPSDQVTIHLECKGICKPGYSFPGGEFKMALGCNSGTLSPFSSFLPCKPTNECDVEIKTKASYSCHTTRQVTSCDIQCHGNPPVNGRFVHVPGRGWSPLLPYCVTKKRIASSRNRCNCSIGGICNPYISKCGRPSVHQGKQGQEKTVLNGGGDRCKCVNGGTCGSSSSECTCPQDYEGAQCEKWKQCGITPMLATRRVTMGEETVPGEFPWQVGLATNPTRTGWNIICGGVLITRDTILTAAHCLTSTTVEDYRLYIGKYYLLSDDEEDDVEEKTPSRLIIHPRYNIAAPFDADIAVIRFNPPVTFTDRIRPICFTDADTSRTNFIPLSKGWVTGWGLTENQVQSEALLKAELPVVSSEDCRQSYEQKGINIQLTDNMYCAGHEEGRTDACEGDSGGPMTFRSRSNRSYVLEGLISFGSPEGCGQPKHYSVYTKVMNFMDWIKENI